MIIANNKPIRIIGYAESSMTHEFVNEISKTRPDDFIEELKHIEGALSEEGYRCSPISIQKVW